MGIGRRFARLVVLGRRRGYRARLMRAVGLREDDAPAAAPSDTPTRADPAPETRASTDGWVRILHLDQLPEGSVTEAIHAGQSMALAAVDGSHYAVEAVCAHAGGPLGEGALDGHELTCRYHGWSYDVRDGTCHTDPDVTLRTWEAKRRGAHVCVHIADDSPQ